MEVPPAPHVARAEHLLRHAQKEGVVGQVGEGGLALQRVGVENWIRAIASQLPWTRRVGNIVRVGTYPLRAAIRPFRAPIAAMRAREMARLREAAEAAARARAGPITKSVRKMAGGVHAAERAMWDTAGFAEKKLRWMLGWSSKDAERAAAAAAAAAAGGSG